MEGQRSPFDKIQLGRREFIRSTTMGLAALPMVTAEAKSPGEDAAKSIPASAKFGLGLASYTLRAFSLNQVIAMTKRVGLSRIVLKSMHLPLESPDETIRMAAEIVREAGLDLYGCGVVYMTKEAEVEKAFRYARTAGMRLIIGAPNLELLDLVNRKVKEYDIRLAIHNHGPDNPLYPTPGNAYEKIKNLDRRIGLCMDIGHTLRAGVEPSAEALKCADRLLDVHIKDVSAAANEGQTVEIGRGIIDIPKFIRTMIKLDYAGTLAFEYEKDEKDPLPGLAESVGYVRGVVAAVQ
jgi:sugar phosphate isomerase/epimerase